MILLNLFIFLIQSSKKDNLIFDIIVGEWDIVASSGKSLTRAFSPYSAEFHNNPLTSNLDGSIWANVNSSDTILDLEDAEIAQLEIEFQSPISGRIYNLKPKKTFMTQFEFKPSGFGASLMAFGKINDEYNFQITITNVTIFKIFIMSSKSSEVSEFYALRMSKPSASSPYSSHIKIFGFIFISILLLQLIIWGCFKYCKSNLENKITQQQENTIIDLDKYSEYLKEQNKMKKD